jgi:S-formylglutathione hydrolase FrmB
MKKISIDFDETLDNECVQTFVSKLVNDGHDVHIVTSRPSETHMWYVELWSNNDLYEVAEKLKIKDENIHFTSYVSKFIFFSELENQDFDFHLDNDELEIKDINKYTKVKGILFDENWETNIEKLLL